MNLNLHDVARDYPMAWRKIQKQINEVENNSGGAVIVPFQADIIGDKLVVVTQTDLIIEGTNRGMVLQFEARLPVELRVV